MNQFKKDDIQAFCVFLYDQERSSATIEKYSRALQRFYEWLPEEKTVDKATVIAFKELLTARFAPAGVNAQLAAINGFFRYMGWYECIVRPLRIQRRVFAAVEKELTREEYLKLVAAAEAKKDTRLSLLLQLMASTGIRVSEIPYVTVEAVARNRIQIHLKGKIRTILLPGKLCNKLKKYHHRCGIHSGPVFLTRRGSVMDRKEIWAQMKRLCLAAGVPEEKVFPHNLRHLFARTFYKAQKDIAQLADVLGHSNIETTRIYLLSSGQEHQHVLDRLQMIC